MTRGARDIDGDWVRTRIARFRDRQGYDPDLERPHRFTEKMLRRLLFDEDPHYRLYATKLAAPYFLRHRGIDGLNFARRLKVVHSIGPGDLDDLPHAFVAKGSYASGLNRIVSDRADLDVEEMRAFFNDRLRKKRNARGHRDRANCVIFEELLPGRNGSVPDDYKFHCFNRADGRFVYFLQWDSDRFGSHRQSFFDGDGRKIDLRFGDVPSHADDERVEGDVEGMARIAREVSRGFDYVRVDLLDTPDGVYFGEITPFHQAAGRPMHPPEWDVRWGDLWDQRFPSFDPAGI